MELKKTQAALLLIFLFGAVTSSAQDYKKFAVDLYGGATYPHMDIAPQFGWLGNAGIRYNLTDILGIGGEFEMGLIQGGEGDLYNRSFKNEYMRFGGNAFLNMGKITRIQENVPNLGLLFHFGGHYMTYEIVEGVYPGDVPLQQKSYEEPVFTFGGTLQYKISDMLAANLDYTYVSASSDWMDGYNTSYNANKFGDRFSTVKLGLSIYLGSGTDHADWVDVEKNKELQEEVAQTNTNLKKVKDSIQDADGDGVIDAVDQDNSTPEGVRVDSKGLPLDTDYDGIPDYLDDCPVEAGTELNNGCPGGKRFQDTTGMQMGGEMSDSTMGGGFDSENRGSESNNESGTGGRKTASGTGNSGTTSGTKANKSGTSSGTSGSSNKGTSGNSRNYSEEDIANYPIVTLDSDKSANPGQEVFYIIAGSFGSKANAIDYSEKLKAQGYDSQILFVNERNLFRVSVGKFQDEFSARQKLEDLKISFKPSVWLLMQ